MPDPTEARAALREAIRKAITDAYYDARNAGETMETAADNATAGVFAALTDKPSEESHD